MVVCAISLIALIVMIIMRLLTNVFDRNASSIAIPISLGLGTAAASLTTLGICMALITVMRRLWDKDESTNDDTDDERRE